MTNRILFTCQAGHIVLPDRKLVLDSRKEGGNLIVIPAREVWERSELTPEELTLWSFLVAATGKAMLDVLPQLEGGCINYWEAGNWALNYHAQPTGAKTAKEFRKVHMHLLGRSRNATDPAWRWGEAPKFPDFLERFSWSSRFERLSAEECQGIVAQAEMLLTTRYGMSVHQINPWAACAECKYPTPLAEGIPKPVCGECLVQA